MKKLFLKSKFFLFLVLLLLTACAENRSIISNIEEREANEILVYLASKNIEAQKIKAPTAQTAQGKQVTLWNITVDPKKSVEATAFLNQQGLPRKKGATLLELFAKAGLMSSDKEENIRYQAGQEEELKNIIRKIDGVIDADVQISFPSTEILPGATPPKTKASVYVKHQGVFDDPNNHLEIKIKRLVSGAIENLDLEDIAVITDKAKLSDISISPEGHFIAEKAKSKEYVSIWSIIMTKNSAKRFRSIFFSLIFLILIFGGVISYLVYKYYPLYQQEKQKNK